jgi:spermidine synthase
MVTKLLLTSLDQTGTVVGRLSGIGTVGAIFGTVVTGFVLVSRVPVSGILVGLGAALVVGSALLQWRLGRRPSPGPLLGVVAGGLAMTVAPGGCDTESTYHCVVVVDDPANESGRTLVLDTLRHSYVDLEDPTLLVFAYIRVIASVTDAAYPDGEALRAYHLGGGGLTLPHYLAAVRPGTHNLVSEIDGGVVDVDRERLGLRTGPLLEVRVEDGRLGLRRLADDSRDVVVGDAFGGVSVPWHLTTREAMSDVRRVLTPEGVYVANVIDHGSLAFARAYVATLAQVFDHVVLAGEPPDLAADPRPGNGGNLVVVASDRELDLAAVQRVMDERGTGWTLVDGADLDAWLGETPVLTDDYAPVDQLLEP